MGVDANPSTSTSKDNYTVPHRTSGLFVLINYRPPRIHKFRSHKESKHVVIVIIIIFIRILTIIVTIVIVSSIRMRIIICTIV